MQTSEIRFLEQKALDIRRDVIEMSRFASGHPIHPGPALSCAEIVAALYFKFMHIDPENPKWPGRDRFVLSKGHGYAAVYAALAERGFFPKEELLTARGINSRLQGHPDMKKTPGIDMTSGSLGNGMATAMGMAYSLKLHGSRAHVYVILGDGECQEGIIWEAAMSAAGFKLDNFTAIVDYNHFQSCGATDSIMSVEPFAAKWEAFGWKTIEINGHDMYDICRALDETVNYHGKPICILANTVKGKGVSYMEHNNRWHCCDMTDEEHIIAVAEVEAAQKKLNECC